MSVFSSESTFNEEHGALNGSSLGLTALHFTNHTVLQIRLNGEMDATYNVTKRGVDTLNDQTSRPIAGFATSMQDHDEDADDFGFEDEHIKDNLADFQVSVKLGDPNNNKMPVICTQIAELYSTVIVPLLHSKETERNTPINATNLTITTSGKIFREDQDGSSDDFGRLVFLLAQIKAMYQ